MLPGLTLSDAKLFFVRLEYSNQCLIQQFPTFTINCSPKLIDAHFGILLGRKCSKFLLVWISLDSQNLFFSQILVKLHTSSS